jgi:hypothetical protein
VHKPLVHPPECIEAIDASSQPPFDDTEHLLASPANAKRLEESIEQANSGEYRLDMRDVDEIKRLTIERCAQVATDAGNEGESRKTKSVCDYIATRIRALKDE